MSSEQKNTNPENTHWPELKLPQESSLLPRELLDARAAALSGSKNVLERLYPDSNDRSL